MIDKTGEVFNRLTVLSFSHAKNSGKNKVVYWSCRCTCGEVLPVRAGSLTNGHTKSCGCLKKEAARAVTEKYIVTHGMSRRNEKNHLPPEYTAYQHAKDRCTNPNFIQWKDYGGRGIKFLFTSFEQFFAVLGSRPKGKTLDRYPN